MGQGGKDDVLDSVEVLDPAQGTWTPTPKLATRERRSPRPCWTAGSTSWGEKRLKEWLKWTRWQRRARMPSLQLNEPTSDPGAHGPEGPQRRSHRRSHRRRPPRRGRASGATTTAAESGNWARCSGTQPFTASMMPAELRGCLGALQRGSTRGTSGTRWLTTARSRSTRPLLGSSCSQWNFQHGESTAAPPDCFTELGVPLRAVQKPRRLTSV